MNRITIKILSVLLCLALLAGGYAGYALFFPGETPPIAVEEKSLQNADESLDTSLLWQDLQRIAAQPHKVGSDALAQVQDSIIERAKALGLKPIIEQSTLTAVEALALRGIIATSETTPEAMRQSAGFGENDSLRLTNIGVFLDAPQTEECVIFMAHADTVPNSPGAFDNSLSVASLLESMRLLAGKALQRDVLFLFTDGEEIGLLGARQFLQNDPAFRERCAAVFNFDSRGNQGVPLLYQSSPGNLKLTRMLQKAVPQLLQLTLTQSIYNSISAETDLDAFLHKGYVGVGMGCISNARIYHTPQDNTDSFSPEAAYSFAKLVTELVLHTATADQMDLQSDDNALAVPLPMGGAIIIPMSWAKIAAWMICAVTLALIGLLLRKEQASFSAVLRGVLGEFALLAAVYALIWGIGYVLTLASGAEHMGQLIYYAVSLLLFAVIAGSILLLLWFALPRILCISAFDRLLAGMALTALTGLLSAFVLPALSYVFMGMLCCSLLALPLRKRTRILGGTVLALSGFCYAFLCIPIVYLLMATLSFTAASFAGCLLVSGLFTLRGMFDVVRE